AARLGAKIGMARERPESVPARARKPQEREHDVVLERVAREQRDDLVGPRQTALRALMRLQTRNFGTEQADRATIAREIAGNQIKKRGLARAIRTDDKPALARHHAQ